MKPTVCAAAVATLSLLLLDQAALPAHAQLPGGYWRLGDIRIAQRPDGMGGQEDDVTKFKTDDRTNPQVIVSNFEVKCSSDRDDETAPTSGNVRAKMYQKIIWEGGTDNLQPSRYFELDVTRGYVCKAGPYRDTDLAPNQRPGTATSTARTPDIGGEANNNSQTTLNVPDEATAHRVIDIGEDVPPVPPDSNFTFNSPYAVRDW